jgi:S1-C subfamily serine protease
LEKQAGIGQPSTKPQPPPGTSTPAGPPEVVGEGTGFFINSNGDLLTNSHVVEECIGVVPLFADAGVKAKPLSVKVLDSDSDLAVVQTNERPQAYAQLSERSARPGEHVVVVGFPLGGGWSKIPSITAGNVMVISPGGDLRLIGVSAPMNPGNSGGPVLAENGAVLGVASAIIPDRQSLGIAVYFRTVETFLETYQIPFETESSQQKLDDVTLGDKAKSYTWRLGCLNYPE